MTYHIMTYNQLLEAIKEIFDSNTRTLDAMALSLEELQDTDANDGEIQSFLRLLNDAYLLFLSASRFWKEYETLIKDKDISLALIERMEVIGYESNHLSIKMGESVPKDKFRLLDEETCKRLNTLYADTRDGLNLLTELSDIAFALNKFRFEHIPQEEGATRVAYKRGDFVVFEDDSIRFSGRDIDLSPFKKKILLLLLRTREGEGVRRGRIAEEISAVTEREPDPEGVSDYISHVRIGLRENGITENEMRIEYVWYGEEPAWRVVLPST
jgi:hypothetical protein